MISAILIILSCALLYAIKGGQHKKLRLYVEHKAGIEHRADGSVLGDMSIPQYIVHRLMDGKTISALGFGVLALLVTAEYQGGTGAEAQYRFVDNAFWFFWLAVAGWLAAVSPKMGRIVGKIGGYKGNWDENEQPYGPDDRDDKLIEGLKEGLMRGVWMGAIMALVFWNPVMIMFGALYPATAWAGVSIEQWRSGMVAASWHIHELICGAVCIGLGLAII